MPLEEILLGFDSDDGTLSVMLEDDGRVAYAYLLQGESIVGDVWLYNTEETPDDLDFDTEPMPFRNPKGFASSEQRPVLRDGTQLTCGWAEDGVEIYADDEVLARIHVGDKPGQSRWALEDSPNARTL